MKEQEVLIVFARNFLFSLKRRVKKVKYERKLIIERLTRFNRSSSQLNRLYSFAKKIAKNKLFISQHIVHPIHVGILENNYNIMCAKKELKILDKKYQTLRRKNREIHEMFDKLNLKVNC